MEKNTENTHYFYGQLSEVIPFLIEAMSNSDLREANLLIKIDKKSSVASKRVFLSLPKPMAYYQSRKCNTPQNHLTDSFLPYMAPEQAEQCNYIVSNGFRPSECWLESEAYRFKSTQVEFKLTFEVEDTPTGKALILNNLGVYVSDKSDLKTFDLHTKGSGVLKATVFNKLKGFSRIYADAHLDQITDMIRSYPTSQGKVSGFDSRLQRPNLRNRFGYDAELNQLPSFSQQPLSLWVGEGTSGFCREYIQYLVDNNVTTYIGVDSPKIRLPNTHSDQTARILFEHLDPLALLAAIRASFPQLNENNRLADLNELCTRLVEEMTTSMLAEHNVGEPDIQKFSVHITKHMGQLVEEASLYNLLVALTQSSPELGGLVDVLLTHYVKPFDGNYEHIVNSLKSERIVIECTANNQQEANSAALLLSIIKSELTAAKISERSTFRSVFPVSILQFDTSDISESELSVIGWVMRLTRKRAIAPFVSVDNVNNVLAESASHKITSTGQENEYCVEYMGNKMIVNAEVI